MGNPADPATVVDPPCRVIGIEGLRVVDASAFPAVVVKMAAEIWDERLTPSAL